MYDIVLLVVFHLVRNDFLQTTFYIQRFNVFNFSQQRFLFNVF